MVKILGVKKPYCNKVRKRLGWPSSPDSIADFGIGAFGDCFFGDPADFMLRSTFGYTSFGTYYYGDYDLVPAYDGFGIYQQRKCVEGKITIKMRFYGPHNPRTVSQQANRNKLGPAIIAWRNLTESEKYVYNKRASGRHCSGYNLFLKEYLLSH